jgi:hypothetical protein
MLAKLESSAHGTYLGIRDEEKRKREGEGERGEGRSI